MKKSALIIANWNYEDPLLRGLVSPSKDAEALAQVLGDATIGAFEVKVLTNAPSYRVSEETDAFFGDRDRDDLLLLYFSGHGITDDDGQLYYAAPNTFHKRLRSTAIAASWVNDIMNECRSRRQVMMLDCCHSGAFARTKAGAGAVNVGKYFTSPGSDEGRGKFILTACDAFQYSFEGEQVAGQGANSVFTEAVIEGLRTGRADLDGDGLISLDELYDFVFRRVRERTPQQTPRKWASDVEGAVVIANNPLPVEAPLPEDLQAAVDNFVPEMRERAIPRLNKLLRGKHRGMALTAHKVLACLANDDSRRVSRAAQQCLAVYNQEVQTGTFHISDISAGIEIEAAEKPAREQTETAAREQTETAAREQSEAAARDLAKKDQAEREQAEREQAEREQVRKDQADREQALAIERAETERLAHEKAEVAKLVLREAEAGRLAREKTRREQADRIFADKAEANRLFRQIPAHHEIARERFAQGVAQPNAAAQTVPHLSVPAAVVPERAPLPPPKSTSADRDVRKRIFGTSLAASAADEEAQKKQNASLSAFEEDGARKVNRRTYPIAAFALVAMILVSSFLFYLFSGLGTKRERKPAEDATATAPPSPGPGLLTQAQDSKPTNSPAPDSTPATASSNSFKDPAAVAGQKRVRVSAGVAAGMLIARTQPIYPPIARAARIAGTVVLEAFISRTGEIQSLQVISGPAMLRQAALDAAKTFRYRPYLLNGQPVAMDTVINIAFSIEK